MRRWLLCVLQGVSHKFIIAVLMEYIRSLNQFQITVQVKPNRVTPRCSSDLCDLKDLVTFFLCCHPQDKLYIFTCSNSHCIFEFIVCVFQHYLYELVIKTLVQHNLFYMLHQFLQYHVLSDSKPLVSSHHRPRPKHLDRPVVAASSVGHNDINNTRWQLPHPGYFGSIVVQREEVETCHPSLCSYMVFTPKVIWNWS